MNHVVHPKYLPIRAPLQLTLLLWLASSYWGWPGWACGVTWCLVGLLWIGWAMAFWSQNFAEPRWRL